MKPTMIPNLTRDLELEPKLVTELRQLKWVEDNRAIGRAIMMRDGDTVDGIRRAGTGVWKRVYTWHDEAHSLRGLLIVGKRVTADCQGATWGVLLEIRGLPAVIRRTYGLWAVKRQIEGVASETWEFKIDLLANAMANAQVEAVHVADRKASRQAAAEALDNG